MDLKAIEERAAKVPPIGYLVTAFGHSWDDDPLDDTSLAIAKLAREDIPNLLAEVKALRTENAQLKDYLLRIRNDALPVDHSMAVLIGFEAGQADLLARVKELETVAEAARDYIQHVGMWNDNMAHRHPCVIQDREESTWDCWINQKLELALIALDTLNPTESDTPSGRG